MNGDPQDDNKALYKGSLKHKNRPAEGAKGTICPEWAHIARDAGLGTDVSKHPWNETRAHQLFMQSELWDPSRRYATAEGIAFEAKPTADGTWHGYPIPWASVPVKVRAKWLKAGTIRARDIKHKCDPADIFWATHLEGSS